MIIQVGILVGDMMEKIDQRWQIELDNRAKKLTTPAEKKPLDLSLPGAADGNKMAGFFA